MAKGNLSGIAAYQVPRLAQGGEEHEHDKQVLKMCVLDQEGSDHEKEKQQRKDDKMMSIRFHR